MRPEFDELDQELLNARHAAFIAPRDYPRVGDFIRFADGTICRIAHIWTDKNDKPESIQYSTPGDASFYFGGYSNAGKFTAYMSYSGGLYPGIPAHTLTRTDEQMPGLVWFFHHDWAQAHNGVYAKVALPIWSCTLPAEHWLDHI